MFQLLELHVVETAFEHRLLNPLAEALASLSHPPQASAPSRRLGVDVIGDKELHRFLATGTRRADTRRDRPEGAAPAASPVREGSARTEPFDRAPGARSLPPSAAGK